MGHRAQELLNDRPGQEGSRNSAGVKRKSAAWNFPGGLVLTRLLMERFRSSTASPVTLDGGTFHQQLSFAKLLTPSPRAHPWAPRPSLKACAADQPPLP
jgi:hypothetical protein